MNSKIWYIPARNDRLEKKVGIYCRVSTAEKEQLYSLAEQISALTRAVANVSQWRLADVFIDIASAKGDIPRREFERLMKECEAHNISVVLTKSISRFGRDTVETLTAINNLKAVGVRIIFEQELEQLKEKVSEMAEQAEIGYDKLSIAIKKNDREVLTQLLSSDGQSKEMLRSIEAQCLALMTKQQPVARDLRLVSAALKIVTDLERIGDHVSDMAELFLRRNSVFGEEENDSLLEEMFATACAMVRDSVEAFGNGDEETAREVIERDDIVDNLFNQVKSAMMEAIQKQSMDADKVVDNLMIAKYLEKVGDHAVNIAEWAVFQITGKIAGQEIY